MHLNPFVCKFVKQASLHKYSLRRLAYIKNPRACVWKTRVKLDDESVSAPEGDDAQRQKTSSIDVFYAFLCYCFILFYYFEKLMVFDF